MAVFDPTTAFGAVGTITNGGLTYNNTQTFNHGSVTTDVEIPTGTGPLQAEFVHGIDQITHNAYGVMSKSAAIAIGTPGSALVGQAAEGVGYRDNGIITKNNVNVQTGLQSLTAGDIVGAVIDRSVAPGTIQFYVNGVAQGTSVALDPSNDLAFAVTARRNRPVVMDPAGPFSFPVAGATPYSTLTPPADPEAIVVDHVVLGTLAETIPTVPTSVEAVVTDHVVLAPLAQVIPTIPPVDVEAIVTDHVVLAPLAQVIPTLPPVDVEAVVVDHVILGAKAEVIPEIPVVVSSTYLRTPWL